MTPTGIEHIALGLVLVLGLGYLYRRDQRKIKRARAEMFDACLSLFESYRVTQDGPNFPVLTGRYQGHQVRLDPVADHIALRKIPSLWLLVSVYGDLPCEGTTDFLVRPQNVEFYSPSSRLEERVPIPEGWPQHAWLRSDHPDPRPTIDRIEHHIRFFDDPKAKELIVSPRGVRLVYQANQAARAHYKILRQVQFEEVSLPVALVKELMDRAVRLFEDFREGGSDLER